MFKVGVVTHFYPKIGVAIVELDNLLAVNDRVKFVLGNDDLFEQKIDSIQVGHKKLDSAGKGEIVGIKTKEQVPEGTEIFKL